MNSYLFFLGQTVDLCWEELVAVAGRFGLPVPTRISEFQATLPIPAEINVGEIQLELGGTIKIAEIVKETPFLEMPDVEEEVFMHLSVEHPRRFAIAEHGRDHLEPIDVITIKNRLAKEGIKASYQDTPRYGANAATLKNRKPTEVHVLQHNDGLIFGITRAWQDVDTWAQRDIDKPHRDVKRGMLSPKVSRMMVNIGIGADQPEDHVVLDPFCGMGTILMEAADLDVKTVLGNDVDHKAVIQSTENLNWWKQISQEEFTFELTVRAAEKLDTLDFAAQPTVIVTEPFLGKLTPRLDQVGGIMRGLEKLYKGTIKAYTRLLKSGGRVVMILPAWQDSRGRVVEMKQTLKDFDHAGFTLVAGPLRGGRPSAVTQRQVYVFERK